MSPNEIFKEKSAVWIRNLSHSKVMPLDENCCVVAKETRKKPLWLKNSQEVHIMWGINCNKLVNDILYKYGINTKIGNHTDKL